jgi:hypothetical protein
MASASLGTSMSPCLTQLRIDAKSTPTASDIAFATCSFTRLAAPPVWP